MSSSSSSSLRTPTPRRLENDENDELAARRREIRSSLPRTPPQKSLNASPKSQAKHKQKVELLHKLQRQNSYFRKELGRSGVPQQQLLEASGSLLRAQKLKASIEIWQSQSPRPLADIGEQEDKDREIQTIEAVPEVDALRAEMGDYKSQLEQIKKTYEDQLSAVTERFERMEMESRARLEQVQALADDYRRQLQAITASQTSPPSAAVRDGTEGGEEKTTTKSYDPSASKRSSAGGFCFYFVSVVVLTYLLMWNLFRHFPIIDAARVAA